MKITNNTVKKVLTILLLSTAITTASAFSATEKCDPKAAFKAETEASTQKTWAALYNSYKMYRHCDEGSVAEGYTNSIANLLAFDWENIERLNTLLRKHPDFKVFIFRHLDETMTEDQGDAMLNNVRTKCPHDMQKFCAEVDDRIVMLKRRSEH